MTNQSFGVHGHFYQPPRENPFTGTIPREKGSDPYPNWNERIYSECYLPNVNLGNYKHISFNFGPTLFEWMRHAYPNTSEKIVIQDLENLRQHGAGNALAQPYHHTILPLATRKDKETQIYWGIVQFLKRFGREPKGIWLPEAAGWVLKLNYRKTPDGGSCAKTCHGEKSYVNAARK